MSKPEAAANSCGAGMGEARGMQACSVAKIRHDGLQNLLLFLRGMPA